MIEDEQRISKKGAKDESQKDQSRGGVKQTSRLVCSPPGGAPRWPMLARQSQVEDEANGSSLEERRDEENRRVWKKHGGLAPREDLPKIKFENHICSSRQDCRRL
ncbi:uncharacterized protein LOC112552493 [Pogonomyrmex barbatus]|uniref:Uncharacterized protein LOC112552493 n=1 Tax=Pogonomyrmex barbatus TaxID=144034 RepID=A0A8N1S690_9HYME|nr:uncharacterized protein LOC112552493 [Pogonomyrmex barbatus]